MCFHVENKGSMQNQAPKIDQSDFSIYTAMH